MFVFIIFAYTYIPIYISFKIFSYIHTYIYTYYICMYVWAELLMYTTEQMYICMYKEHLYFFPFKDSFRFFCSLLLFSFTLDILIFFDFFWRRIFYLFDELNDTCSFIKIHTRTHVHMQILFLYKILEFELMLLNILISISIEMILEKTFLRSFIHSLKIQKKEEIYRVQIDDINNATKTLWFSNASD